ncbi:PIN domain-containing protein [Desulfococcaceae bacterium HSG7]|nr:PIN domain-containing protein [Desulfococcaceae bacterium HSG7]
MRNLFLGYYKPQQEEVIKLRRNADIVFDANALLNIYSYSQQTRDITLKVLEKIKDRLWLPYQFALEYQQNRLDRISQETKNITDVKDKILNLLDSEIKPFRRHPFLTELQKQQLQEIYEALKKAEKQHEELLAEDPFHAQVAEIFNGKIGTAPNETEKEIFYKNGKHRYAKEIPPGFCDYNKKDESANTYGDYIGWIQIINHAKDKKTDIILVTDDLKKDWWVKKRGKRIGPRTELIDEFNAESDGKIVHMYSCSSFLSHASTIIDIKISEEVIEEARETPVIMDLHSKPKYIKKSKVDTPKMSGFEKKEAIKRVRDPDSPKTTNGIEEG